MKKIRKPLGDIISVAVGTGGVVSWAHFQLCFGGSSFNFWVMQFPFVFYSGDLKN